MAQIVTIGLGTFIVGLFTVIVPALAIPDCTSVVAPGAALPLPDVKPFTPIVRPICSPSCVVLLHGAHSMPRMQIPWCHLPGARSARVFICGGGLMVLHTVHAHRQRGCGGVRHCFRAAPMHTQDAAPPASLPPVCTSLRGFAGARLPQPMVRSTGNALASRLSL